MNYKEPLRSVRGGFGYYGTLLATFDGTKVMCHTCGELYGELSKHIQRHNLTAAEYREKYQLSRQTALISETIRNARKERTVQWIASLSDEERTEFRERQRARYRAWQKEKHARRQPKSALETKNKRGTCPDQLLERIMEVKRVLKRTPSKAEFIDHYGSQRYVHLIYKTHGSWANALKMCGMQPKEQERNGGRRNYTKEALLEYLRIFYQENNKVPTETDCRRGLIPDSGIYRKRFGSFTHARSLAGINALVGRHIK